MTEENPGFDPKIDKQLAQVAQGQRAEVLKEHIGPYLDKLAAQIQAKAFRAIDKGEMTPALAQQLWMERHTLHRFAIAVNQDIKLGKGVASRLKDHMEGS